MENKDLIKVTCVTIHIDYMKPEFDPGFIERFFNTQVAASWYVHSVMLACDDLNLVNFKFEDWKRSDFRNNYDWLEWVENIKVYTADDVLKENFVYDILPEKWFEATKMEFSDE